MPAPLMRVQLPNSTSPKATATAVQLRRAKRVTDPQFIPESPGPTTTSVVRRLAARERAVYVLGGAVFVRRDIGQARFKIPGGRGGFLRGGRLVGVVADRIRVHPR